jgi:hypothetical protein
MKTTSSESIVPEPKARKRWEEPCIVLERGLEVSAQGSPPGSNPFQPPNGFLGPLGTSGGSGTCG